MTGSYQCRARSRERNEAIERASVSTYRDGQRGRFVCECGDGTCVSSMLLTLAEYEGVREYATRFAIARDHENPELDAVIREHDRWAVVEEVGREAVMAARRSDPRRR